MEQQNQFAWSARCDCYNGHASESGRCRNRNDGPVGFNRFGITDPTHKPGEVAICSECRENCRKKEEKV